MLDQFEIIIFQTGRVLRNSSIFSEKIQGFSPHTRRLSLVFIFLLDCTLQVYSYLNDFLRINGIRQTNKVF
jgi:hypothetical protein